MSVRVRSMVLLATLAAPGCTAPVGHPYCPLAVGNAWNYAGHQRSPRGGVSPRHDYVDITALSRDRARIHATADLTRVGLAGHQSSGEQAWIVTTGGLLPTGPATAELSGLALPIDLPRAAPWTGTVTAEDFGETIRAEVVGRRSLTVPAGTFTTVVVRGELTTGEDHFTLLVDHACGVGTIRTVAQDGAGYGFDLQLEKMQVDPEGRRGCDAEDLDHLPVLGAAEIAAAATRRCDLAALESLGRELEEHPTTELRIAAPARLAAACADALPPSLAAYLATGRDILPYAHAPEVDAWLDLACPALDSAARSRETWAGPTLTPALYDACDLAAHGVLARGDIDGTASHLLAWAVHHWLISQGTSRAAARALTRTLHALERRTTRFPAGGRLPIAQGRLLTGDRLSVSITPTEVRIDGRAVPIVDARGERLPDIDLEPIADPLINAAIFEEQAGRDPAAFPILLSVDAAASMSLVVEVMRHLNRVGLRNGLLQVEGDDGRLRVIPLAPAADAGPALLVHFDDTHLGVGDVPLRDIPLADPGALAAHVAAFTRAQPNVRRVEFVAHRSTTLASFLAVLATIRGPGCDARGDCRLPDVVLHPYLRL